MHRVDTDGHLANLFTDGDPGIGQEATIIGEDWLNDVQEDLCNLIEDAGVTLVKGSQTQLQAAINAYAWVFTGIANLKIGNVAALSTPNTPHLSLLSSSQFHLYMQDARGANGNQVGRLVYDGSSESGGTGNEAHPSWVFQRAANSGVFTSNGVKIFNGTNPSATTGFTNSVTVKNIVKASGSAQSAGGVVSLLDGFNTASAAASGGNEIRITIADDMSSANYAVVVTVTDGTDRVPRVLNKAAGLFDVQFYDLSLASLIVPALDDVTFDYIVVGAQP